MQGERKTKRKRSFQDLFCRAAAYLIQSSARRAKNKSKQVLEFAFATMPPIFTERKFKKERFLRIFRNFQTQNLQIPAKSSTFVPRFSDKDVSGRSAVRLAHLLWEQGVEGSNPFTPTRKRRKSAFCDFRRFSFTNPADILQSNCSRNAQN